MVSLAPPLRAVLEIRLCLENGSSVSESIRYFSKKYIDDLFAKQLGYWLFAKEAGHVEVPSFESKPYRQSLVDILERGLQGEPILEHLKGLEQDLYILANEDMEHYIQKLPFISLIPLMLFQFPAFILLLLGPLLLDLLAMF